jgi:hypothetical protein
MKERDSMILYRSFYEAIIELPESNQLEIMKAIFEYGFDGVEPKLSGLSKTIWILIKPNLEANRRKWENGCQPKQKQSVSKTEANTKQSGSKTEGNVYVDVDVEEDKDVEEEENDKIINTKKLDKRFVSPTIQEVAEYVKSKHPSAHQDRVNVFAEKFWSHYENKSWSYGKNQKMKDWRLAMSQWKETIEKDLYPSGLFVKPAINNSVRYKVEYYDARWPDRTYICTEDEFKQLQDAEPDETFVVKRKY